MFKGFPVAGRPIARRMIRCSSPAGRKRVPSINSLASRPTARRANGARSSRSFSSAPSETLGRVREQAHREPAPAMDARVVRRVRTLVVAVVGGLLGDDVRLEGSRHQDGDAQPERRDLLRQRLGPPLEGGLGRRVGADRRHAPATPLARYDDDPAASRLSHGGEQRSGERDRPEEIGGEDLLEDPVRHVLDRADGGDPGIVDEDVGRTDRLLDGLGSRHDRRGVVEVESDAEQARILGARTGRRAQALKAHVGRAHRSDDAPSGLVEMGGGRQAESAGRTGDDDAPRLTRGRACRFHLPSPGSRSDVRSAARSSRCSSGPRSRGRAAPSRS